MSDAGLAIATLLGIPAALWALIKLYCIRAERQHPYPPHVNSAAQIRILNTRRHERDPDATDILPPVNDPATTAAPGRSSQRRKPGAREPGFLTRSRRPRGRHTREPIQ